MAGPLGKGFPDLVLVRARDRRLIFAELKRDGEYPTPDQARVLTLLSSVEQLPVAPLRPVGVRSVRSDAPRIEVYIWRPADWPEIEAILR